MDGNDGLKSNVELVEDESDGPFEEDCVPNVDGPLEEDVCVANVEGPCTTEDGAANDGPIDEN